MNANEISTKDFLKIDKNEKVSNLIGKLVKEKCRAAVVVDGKKYLGITRRRLLMKTNLKPSSTKVNSVIEKVPVLKGTESIQEVARLLSAVDAPLLPIVKDNEAVAVVNAIDVVAHLKDTAHASMKISKIMTPTPATVKETERIGEAMYIMHEKRFGRLPVVDEKGILIGVLTFTDILKHFIAKLDGKAEHASKSSMRGAVGIRGEKGEKIEMSSFPITSIFSRVLITLDENSTVRDAVDLIEKNHISSVIIVKDKKPIGIVAIKDLLKLFLVEEIPIRKR